MRGDGILGGATGAKGWSRVEREDWNTQTGEDRRSDIKVEQRRIIWSETGCSQTGNTTSASYLTHVLALELISVTDAKLIFWQSAQAGNHLMLSNDEKKHCRVTAEADGF